MATDMSLKQSLCVVSQFGWAFCWRSRVPALCRHLLARHIRLHGTLDCTSAGAACIGMRRFRQLWSLHTAASVIGIFHDHKSFPEFLVPSYVKAETAVHWNLSYDRKQGCHPCLRLLIRYSTNSKKGDFDMCSWNGCGNNCGGFGNNCGGWGWNNWGCGGSCGWNRNNREAFRNGFREGYDAGFRDGFREGRDDDRRPGGPGGPGRPGDGCNSGCGCS